MPPSGKQTLEIPSGMYSMGRLNVRPEMIPASPPSTTLGFEAAPAASLQQRFLQSSASPNEVAPPSQHDQQTHCCYLAHPAQQSNSDGLTNRSNQEDVDMNERHAQKDQQFLKTFLEETMREVVSAVGLLRYNSAPSSVLAGLVGMGNDYLSQERGLTHVFPEGGVCTSAQIASKQDRPETKGINLALNSARAGMRVTDQNVKVSGSDPEPEHRRLHSQHSHVEQNANRLENQSSQSLVEGHGEDMGMANVSFSAPLTHGISEPSINAAILHTGASNSVPTLPSSSSFSVGGLASWRSDEFVTSASLRVPSPSKGVGNLLRQSSSPAGLLSHLNDSFLDYEKVPLPCSSGNSSEEGSYERRELTANCVLGEGCSAAENAIDGSPTGASLAARKRIRELENKLLQREAPELHGLSSNHFVLPMATSAENLYPTDNLSPDNTVPCRARAKRGCATHPRSIAERVRRTKISERMKRLQELVPNMDKQTNTAEMLDEAVEYVKFLQRQVQELKENQSRCQCTRREKESSE